MNETSEMPLVATMPESPTTAAGHVPSRSVEHASIKNFGLDVMRATAILLVLVAHSGWQNRFMFHLGYYGVELFFGLSGFLIGQIIIRDVLQKPSFQNLFTFYQRRWLRTLPLYYLVLVLLLFEFAASGRFPAQWWTYFVFVQNFSPTLSYFFGPSWSLSIEEWSYLTIPLVLLLLPVKKHSGFSIFLFTVAWALLIFFGRYWMIHQPMPDYDAGIRKNIPLRLDAIIFGFAMANIKLHYRKIFEWLGSALVFTGVIVLFAAINLLVPNALVYDFVGEKTIPGSMGFSAIGIFIALLLPFLSQHQWMKRAGEWRWLRIFFTRISLYSYCMYLVHGTVYHYVITRPGLSWPWLGQVTLALVIIVALAALSYRMIEKPILDWRDRNVRIIR